MTTQDDRTAWLAERRQGLGASDAAAACGLSPWTTPLELYLQKTGRAPEPEETLPMRAGKALEPVVLRAFAERTGQPVTDQQLRLTDPALPWRYATIDGRTTGGDLVEAKTASRMDNWGEDGSYLIPNHYRLQVQHQMAVAGAALCWVPVLFSARELRVYRVERDQAAIDAMTATEAEFWQRVLDGRPPDAVTSADVRLLWPADSGASITATADILAALDELRAARASATRADERVDALQATVQGFMADASVLLGPDGKTLATWKAVKSSRLDSKALVAAHPDIASQYRVESSTRRFALK